MTSHEIGIRRARVARRSGIVRLAAGGFTLCVTAILAVTAAYGLRLRDTADMVALPPTAVVFTGQFDRIVLGLDLLSEGKIQTLFISGVNRGAGLSTSGFADQFHLSPRLREDLASGRIILKSEAQDTLENACETSRWLRAGPPVNTLLLITSRRHMPRASLALERAARFRVRIERLSVGEELLQDPAAFLSETVKFAKTLAISFLPERLWPDDENGLCRAG